MSSSALKRRPSIEYVYIAAPYPMKSDAITLRSALHEAGIVVTSRWLNGVMDTDQIAAEADIADIRRAHALVMINPMRWANEGTGGRHVEVGAALMLGLPIYLLGIKSNVFHTLRQCQHVETIAELVTRLTFDSRFTSYRV